MSTIDKEMISFFKQKIYQNLGIRLSEEKEYILESKLNRLILRNKYPDLKSFYERIQSGDKESFEILIQYITTTFTLFFRENEHLQILKNLVSLKKKENYIIWSAASSTGEEAYSIIITLLEAGIKNFLIIASDINKEVLYKTRSGIYSAERLRVIDENIKRKYFNLLQNGSYQISDNLRKYIIIKKLNLIEEFYFKEKIDFIFCRNVMIYFDEETRKKAVNNLVNNLSEDGYLFIGQSENLLNITNRLESVFVSVYNKTNREKM